MIVFCAKKWRFNRAQRTFQVKLKQVIWQLEAKYVTLCFSQGVELVVFECNQPCEIVKYLSKTNSYRFRQAKCSSLCPIMTRLIPDEFTVTAFGLYLYLALKRKKKNVFFLQQK